MTIPTIDGMPYGVVLEPIVGSALFQAVESHPKLDGFNLNLTPGPCQISYTWDGEQSCALVLRRNGKIREIDAFPAKTGGGVRSPRSFKIGAVAGDQLYLYLRPNYVDTGINPTGTMEVIPMIEF